MSTSILCHAFAHHAWANERIFEACDLAGGGPIPAAGEMMRHVTFADAD